MAWLCEHSRAICNSQPALVSEVLHHPDMDKMLDVYSAITEVHFLRFCARVAVHDAHVNNRPRGLAHKACLPMVLTGRC